MKSHKKIEILNFFSNLNNSGINYLLLRNTANEMPSKLKKNKDIDLWISYDHRPLLINFFKKYNFIKIRHPLRKLDRLYGINEFEMYKNSAELLIDINYQICVKSLSKIHLVPLDDFIQKNIFKNKKKIYFDQIPINHMGDNEYLVSIIARQIYDKENFDDWAMNEINRLMPVCNVNIVYKYLKLIFFKFTDDLIKMINKKQFKLIKTNYIRFQKY